MRVRRVFTGCVAAALLLALAGRVGFGQEKSESGAKEGKAQPAAPALPRCPIMDEPVNFAVSTMADDGPVYFCCPQCISKFEADPKKYAAKVTAQREALAKLPKVQVKCPLTGKPIKKDALLEQAGEKLYFCCPDCPAKYKANPAQYKAKLATCYTYQTRCPVTGEAIDPTAFADLPDGSRVYYCCIGCDAKLRKEPAKYAKKLEEQGTHLNLKKLQAAGEGGKK